MMKTCLVSWMFCSLDTLKLHYITVLVNYQSTGEWSRGGREVAGHLGMVNRPMSLYLFVANLSVFYLLCHMVLGPALFMVVISSNSLTCLLFFLNSLRLESLSACECLDYGYNDESVWRESSRNTSWHSHYTKLALMMMEMETCNLSYIFS